MYTQLALPTHTHLLRADRFGTPHLALHGAGTTHSQTAAARFALLEALAERRQARRRR